jgi:hypothetical protein
MGFNLAFKGLICQGLKNTKALFTSLLLELAEIEFLPAFV